MLTGGAVGAKMITEKNQLCQSDGTNWPTSSPSPIQRPSKDHADQFHGYPAMDKIMLSIASSLLLRRERKRLFLSSWGDEVSH